MSSTRHIPENNDSFPRKCHVPRKKTTRYRNIRRKICRKIKNSAGKGWANARRGGRENRYICNSHLSLGIWAKNSRCSKVSRNFPSLQDQEGKKSVARRIKFYQWLNAPVDIILPLVKISLATSGSHATLVADGVAYNLFNPRGFLIPLDKSVPSLDVVVRREGLARRFVNEKGGHYEFCQCKQRKEVCHD